MTRGDRVFDDTHVHLLPRQVGVSRTLVKNVDATDISGKRIHDANIAATIHVHRVTEVATANIGDYTGPAEIHVLTPAETFRKIRVLMEEDGILES